MSRLEIACCTLLCALVGLLPRPAMAQAYVDWPVVKTHVLKVDVTQDPQSTGEWANQPEVKSALAGIAAYFGMDAATVMTLIELLPGQHTSKGAEHFLNWDLAEQDPYYYYCGSRTDLISNVDSHLEVVAYNHAVGAYVVVPQGRWGEGRKWMDATITVAMVRGDKIGEMWNTGKCVWGPRAPVSEQEICGKSFNGCGRTVFACKGKNCAGPYIDNPSLPQLLR